MAKHTDRNTWASGYPTYVSPGLKALGRALLMFPEKYRWCKELAESAGLGTGSVSPMLKKMEAVGWLEQCPYYKDEAYPKRVFYLLTKEGEEILSAMVWSEPTTRSKSKKVS